MMVVKRPSEGRRPVLRGREEGEALEEVILN
jgi:hypothetical protein